MQSMFTAYREILSPYGQKTRAFVDTAVQQVPSLPADSEIANQARAVTTLMPDPQHVELGQWYDWFDLSQVSAKEGGFAFGCLEPCQHCCVGNGTFLIKNDPLPVLIKKMTDLPNGGLTLYCESDFFDWYDPFFGATLFTIFELHTRIPSKMSYSINTHGWEKDDKIRQSAAQALAQLPLQRMLNLSVHLCLSTPDLHLIRAVCQADGHTVPDRIINAYAERTANIIQTLGKTLLTIFLFSKYAWPDNAQLQFRSEPVYNKAVNMVFERTLRMLGADASTINRFLLLADQPAPGSIGLGDIPVVFATIGNKQGADFFSRLDAALDGRWQPKEKSHITDRGFPLKPYPLVVIYQGGKVAVTSHVRRGEILFESTIGELSALGGQ